jgi:hypothetical protein
MEFFGYTLNWIKGEIFEGWMIALWGTLLLILTAYFWKFGQTSTIRALIIPFLLIGLIWSIAGVSGVFIQKQRIPRYQKAYQQDPAAFIQNEKERVGGFIGWYRYGLGGGMVLVLAGLALFRLWGGNHGRAIGLALILAGFSLLLIDHISQHNALTYQEEINKVLES